MGDSLKGTCGNRHLEKTSLSIYVNINNTITMVQVSVVGIIQKNLTPYALVCAPAMAYTVSCAFVVQLSL
jgi:hypothetical protein